MINRCYIILALTLVLVGCVSPRLSPSLLLPAPADANVTGSFQQLIQVQHNETQQLLIASIEVNADHLTVVVLHPSGIRLMSAEYDGETIRQQQLMMPGVDIRAEQVLKDIMLALWPMASWQPYLQQQGWVMADDGRQRLVSRADGEPVYRIKYHGEASQRWYSSLTLEQLQFNYHLAINPIDEEQ
ncbi:hypothetical protein SIN8267_01617 [Sinobacterium norvegicum]|uniref:DUF3261 domain-containing protein n=1 Tax=Sinobacterium norvegicum TaxID=1641715 RepID=A0ABN8EN18_9GAMM|nr:DUF3261 domain-containing protein [Sinobacterium norvegicum]CAH0991511.1 hypothetical protein SIN8267_01617 [Sinobacterium norvegicum]